MAKEYKAFLKSAQISARKSRLVVDMVRGDQVQDALEKLKFMNKKAAPLVVKLIKSAMASACAKSILSFKKARSENSPGFAIRTPFSDITAVSN